jgi:hypothetical protein
MHLADLTAYLEADRALCELYADRDGWARKAILNVAYSGKFSSDWTIAQYAAEVWQVKPCPLLCAERAKWHCHLSPASRPRRRCWSISAG